MHRVQVRVGGMKYDEPTPGCGWCKMDILKVGGGHVLELFGHGQCLFVPCSEFVAVRLRRHDDVAANEMPNESPAS